MHQDPSLTSENIHFLRQGLELLEGLDDETYTRKPSIPMSPVGGHLRHCLDFYDCFLKGLESGHVDYDARCRDPRVETDRRYAMDRINGIIERLGRLQRGEEERLVDVSMDKSERDAGGEVWSRATVRRELQFLRSHTVHHYALIAAVLRLLDVEPGEEFGVAPSTLEHRRQLAAH